MRVRFDQLLKTLEKQLSPIYLISGAEPCQLVEAADNIRLAAKKAGFQEREVLSVDGSFQWQALLDSAMTLSIFSEKKLIDLRIDSGKVGKEGAKVLAEYAKNPPQDCILLITIGKLTPASQKSQWFRAVESAGVILQVWPLEGQKLVAWLQASLKKKGMQVDQQGISFLASRLEGNLLAASQEIEKLFTLLGPGVIKRDTLIDVITDQAKFDVFSLAESLLQGHLKRTYRILQILQAEGTPPALVLWVITREVRILLKLKETRQNNDVLEPVFKQFQIWSQRQAYYTKAIQRLDRSVLHQAVLKAQLADNQIKGLLPGVAWETLLELSMDLAKSKQLKMPA